MEKITEQNVATSKDGKGFVITDINKEFILSETGYQIKTELFKKLSVMELWGGEKAAREVVEQCLVEWESDVTLFTELAFLLSWKAWIHRGMGNEKYEKMYTKLFGRVFRKGISLFKGDDLGYFLSTLD